MRRLPKPRLSSVFLTTVVITIRSYFRIQLARWLDVQKLPGGVAAIRAYISLSNWSRLLLENLQLRFRLIKLSLKFRYLTFKLRRLQKEIDILFLQRGITVAGQDEPLLENDCRSVLVNQSLDLRKDGGLTFLTIHLVEGFRLAICACVLVLTIPIA